MEKSKENKINTVKIVLRNFTFKGAFYKKGTKFKGNFDETKKLLLKNYLKN